MLVAAIGMLCLGFVILYISMFFIVRLKEHTVTGLVGVAGVLLGGVVAKFLTDNTTAGLDNVWWYPIGLFIGLVTWVILRALKPDAPVINTPGGASPQDGPTILLPDRHYAVMHADQIDTLLAQIPKSEDGEATGTREG